MKKINKLTLSAMMAATCVAILSIGSLFPSLDLSLSLIAGLVVMIVSCEFADRMAWAVFAVSAVLAFVLPYRYPALFYLGLFGWYPILQKKINMLPRLAATLIKFVLFNTLSVVYFVLFDGLTELRMFSLYAATLLVANLLFYLYDLLLDRFLIWYILKIRKRMPWN